jgi:hypothetical protein
MSLLWVQLCSQILSDDAHVDSCQFSHLNLYPPPTHRKTVNKVRDEKIEKEFCGTFFVFEAQFFVVFLFMWKGRARFRLSILTKYFFFYRYQRTRHPHRRGVARVSSMLQVLQLPEKLASPLEVWVRRRGERVVSILSIRNSL